MENFPETLLLKIFSYLRTDELTRVSRVNSVWRRVSRDWRLWQRVNLRNYSNNIRDLRLRKLIKTVFPAELLCLDLSGFKISTGTLYTLREKCPRLISLNLESAVFHESYRNSSRVKYFPRNLRKLNVINTTGPPSVYKNISESLDIDQLECFGAGDEFIESLEASTSHIFLDFFLRQRWSLKILEFSYCEKLTDLALTFITFCCRNLQSLCVRRCGKITGHFLHSMFVVAPSLRSLALDGTMVKDEQLQTIHWDKCLVTELDLSWCRHITEAGLLTVLPNLRFLRYLRLGLCGYGHALTDRVLQKMSRRSWNFLEVLDISFSNQITNKPTREFLLKCTNLRHLRLSNCRKLTESVLSEFENIPRPHNLYVLANFDIVKDSGDVKNALSDHVTNPKGGYPPDSTALRTLCVSREMHFYDFNACSF